jgi:hypothetical protein
VLLLVVPVLLVPVVVPVVLSPDVVPMVPVLVPPVVPIVDWSSDDAELELLDGVVDCGCATVAAAVSIAVAVINEMDGWMRIVCTPCTGCFRAAMRPVIESVQ